MEKYSCAIAVVFCSLFSLAQQDNGYSKFEIVGFGGIGYAKIQSNVQTNNNLDINGGELLINYKAWQKLGIATGIGYMQLSGNGFNEIGIFYQERELIK